MSFENLQGLVIIPNNTMTDKTRRCKADLWNMETAESEESFEDYPEISHFLLDR